jgi:hypothetical protein
MRCVLAVVCRTTALRVYGCTYPCGQLCREDVDGKDASDDDDDGGAFFITEADVDDLAAAA